MLLLDHAGQIMFLCGESLTIPLEGTTLVGDYTTALLNVGQALNVGHVTLEPDGFVGAGLKC
jgi:hypothetical protein